MRSVAWRRGNLPAHYVIRDIRISRISEPPGALNDFEIGVIALEDMDAHGQPRAPRGRMSEVWLKS